MTTFWVIFSDPDAPRDKQFKGVAIVDMDESKRECCWAEVIERCLELGINPGRGVFVQTLVKSIPEEHKNKLITDEALLMKLGSRGRAKANVN